MVLTESELVLVVSALSAALLFDAREAREEKERKAWWLLRAKLQREILGQYQSK